MISGAFSVTHQAVQLGFLPRLRTEHTSEKAAGQIYIPAVNWGLLVMVDPAGPRLPRIRPARVGLWHRRHRHDADHDDDARRPGVPGLEVEPAARGGDDRPLPARRRHLFRVEHHQDPRRRLVPAAGRGDQLHRADDLGEGPRSSCASGSRKSALPLAGVHQIGGGIGASGPRHVGVPVDLAPTRPGGAAAQSEAQPGAPRAGADPQRQGRGSAARSGRQAARGP